MKIFFRFYHPGWWVLILLAATLRIAVPDAFKVSGVVINLASTFLLFKLATLIHECGHLLVAKMCGAVPKRMILGIGYEIFRTHVNGVRVVINSLPVGGQAWADFANTDFTKWKFGAYVAGGAIFNVLVASIVYLLFGFNPYFLTGSAGIDIPSAIIATNMFGVISLIPFYTKNYGSRAATDGMILLKLLFDFKGEFRKNASTIDIHEAVECYERRDYDKAYAIFQQYHDTFPNDPTSLLNMASIHVRRGEIDDALSILQALEKDVHTKRFKGYREYLYSGMASIYLVKNDIDVAFHYASLALRESPRSNYIWAIYGALLIERGSDKNGMRWLFKIMDFEYPNPLAMCASMYLMVAFHQRGDMRSRELHLNFVKRNIGLLDADGRIILNRNLEKIGEPAMIGDM